MDDLPLVAINKVFCGVTGYGPDEALGRNCRFLQPPGGAGPVRERMHAFISDPAQGEARFVLPNITRAGEPFLNIVYMGKIARQGKPAYILGSQFKVKRANHGLASYEQALRSDLVSLSDILSEADWMLLGSMQAIANSSALLARHYLEG